MRVQQYPQAALLRLYLQRLAGALQRQASGSVTRGVR